MVAMLLSGFAPLGGRARGCGGVGTGGGGVADAGVDNPVPGFGVVAVDFGLQAAVLFLHEDGDAD